VKPRKVLIITHNYPTSFSERRNAGIFVHDFAKELTSQGVQVFVFCPSATKNPGNIEGIPVHWFSWGRPNKSLKELKVWNPLDLLSLLIFFIYGFKESINYAQKIKPDYCLSMWAVPSGIFSLAIKKKLNIPYGIWVLGSDIYVYGRLPIFGQIIKSVLKNANHLFSDGYDLAIKVAKMSAKKCHFLPSGTSFADKLKLPRVKRSKSQTVLTFVGRMEQEKGPDVLVDAVLELAQNVRSKIFVNLIGDGTLLDVLKNKVAEKGVDSTFYFFGNVDDKQKIFDVIHNSDWLVIPSRSDSIPLVFSESMKAGTPIIAAGLPDLKYLVEKYKVGLNFKPGDKRVLSKILSNLPTKIQRNKMAVNTSQAAENFKLKTSVTSFLKIVH